jgi:hypothetical protein
MESRHQVCIDILNIKTLSNDKYEHVIWSFVTTNLKATCVK